MVLVGTLAYMAWLNELGASHGLQQHTVTPRVPQFLQLGDVVQRR